VIFTLIYLCFLHTSHASYFILHFTDTVVSLVSTLTKLHKNCIRGKNVYWDGIYITGHFADSS